MFDVMRSNGAYALPIIGRRPRQRWQPRVLTILLVGTHLGWTSTMAAESQLQLQPGVVFEEFIFERAPFPSCHASTIVETKEGLLAAWFGGTYEEHPDVGIWLATKTDNGWTAPVEIANGVQGDDKRYPTWNPVLFQPSEGPLLLFFKIGPKPDNWWGMVMTSPDQGRTWSTPRRLPDGMLGPIKNKPVELPDGTLLHPSSSEHDGWRVHFETSDSAANSWQRTPSVNNPAMFAAIQPTILEHGNGRIQALGRTQKRGVFQIWSDDYGRTWGPMSTIDLPNPNSGIDGVTLNDGRHLLVYNHTRDSRRRLNVAISPNGKEWFAALELENDADRTQRYSYPAVVQTRDGLVHIAYTWRRERIKHVVADPTKLSMVPIVSGKWPKLE